MTEFAGSTVTISIKAGKPLDPNAAQYSIQLTDESDEEHTVSVVAIKPQGWRDAWRVLRGTYVPKVRRERRLTALGWHRLLDKAWTEKLRAALNEPSPLFSRLK